MVEKKSCQRCGKCCKECFNTVVVTYEDYDRFDDETKSYFMLVNPEDGIYEFIDPDSGNMLNECPFLEKIENESIYKCQIYDMRPNSCRNYYCK